MMRSLIAKHGSIMIEEDKLKQREKADKRYGKEMRGDLEETSDDEKHRHGKKSMRGRDNRYKKQLNEEDEELRDESDE